MNPFLNPVFSLRMFKHYVTDIDRVYKLKPSEIKKYQDKALKSTLKYAYNVPLYNKKYKAVGIHPKDISGVDDLHKLPVITKEDLIDAFPNNIIPPNFSKKNTYSYFVRTSGSSGKPLNMYKDIGYVVIETLGGIRQFNAYGISWKNSRIINIGDFSIEGSTDEECLKKGLIKQLSVFFSLNNCLNLYTGEKIKDLLKKIEEFQPNLIIGYTSVLMALALAKNKKNTGNGNSCIIISSGECLDEYSRDYIQTSFNAKVFNLYASTEGGPIAFECIKKGFHINSDFVHVEILDKENNPVEEGKMGNVVITRLYAGGTPIIRYSGLEDIASFDNTSCDCGNNTVKLKNLEGRKEGFIVLPDGRIFSSATISMPLIEIKNKFSNLKIKRFQFVQKNLDEIEILLEIQNEKNNEATTVDKFIKELKRKYTEFFGNNIDIKVCLVDEVEKLNGSLHPPQVISKLEKNILGQIL